jgi:hypothetical protein
MSGGVPVRSDRCGLEELFVSYETGDAERSRLALGPGPHYTSLKAELGTIATSLARTIDNP